MRDECYRQDACGTDTLVCALTSLRDLNLDAVIDFQVNLDAVIDFQAAASVTSTDKSVCATLECARQKERVHV